MKPEELNLTNREEALLTEHCARLLPQDHDIQPVLDEVVHAYLCGYASDEQRALVEEAMLASRSFCDEMLEMAHYLDSFEAQEAERRTDRRHRGIWRWRPAFAVAAVAALVALVVLVLALPFASRWRAHKTLPGTIHLAMLPIECAGDVVSAAFCDGLLETATQKVARLERFDPSFWVVPPDAVARAKVFAPEDAWRRFGATLALTGKFERRRDDFALTLVLVNLLTQTPTPIRSIDIVAPMADLAILQAAIVERVGEMLSMGLPAEAAPAIRSGDTSVPEAYERYVEGRGYLLRYEQVEELERAIDAFRSALDSDSTYALARTGLAEAYWRMFRRTGDTEWIERANQECARSLALDGSLASTHVAFGNVLNESGLYEQAIASFQRALELDSTMTTIYNGLASSQAELGRLEDAEATYRRAVLAKPDYWGGYNDLGLFYYRQGRFEEAAGQYRRIAELTPDNYLAFSNLGAMLYYLEDWDGAREAFRSSIAIHPTDRAYLNLASVYYIEGDYETAAELSEQAVSLNESNYKAWAALGNARYWIDGERERATEAYRRAITLAEERLALNPGDVRMRATLASYYVVVGEDEKARSYVDTALESTSRSPFVVYFAGYVYEQLGDRTRALELIDQAIELGYPIREIERDPWLDDLRADERFQQLLDAR